MPITAILILVLGWTAIASADEIRMERVVNLSGHERFDGGTSAPVATLGLWRQIVDESRRAGGGGEHPRDLARRARGAAAPHEIPIGLIDRTTADGDGIFAAAPLRSATRRGEQVVFVISPDWILGERPAALELDAGDGWRPFPPDGRLPHRFDRTGPHVLRLRATGRDGSTRHAACTLDVKALRTPAPDDTLHVTASVAWEGVAASGQAYVALAPGHAVITDPVVVVEGFDLDDTMDWDPLYELLNQEGLLETLRAEGFDAVVLDFDDPVAPIQRNAMLVAELLAEVEGRIAPDRTMAVVGASMGGLVTRYALGWIAREGIDRRVRTWISFDAPHRGAVIPLGLQHWLDFFSADSEDAAYLLSRLDSPAARQMLLHHHRATSGTVASPDPLRGELTADLAAVGLPACRRVAVANGSGHGTGQGFAPGQQLVRYEYRSLLLDITGNVWAVPDVTPTRIFEGEKDLLWPLPDENRTVVVEGTAPWDGAPGGWRASLAQLDTTSVPYGEIEALQDVHCFIPTLSALDLDVSDPHHDVLGNPPPQGPDAFDALFVPELNEEHIHIGPETAAWLLTEIRHPTTQAPLRPAVAALQVHPNPFNARTTLTLEMAAPGEARLEIFDLRGRRAALLLEERLPSGRRHVPWDGRDGGGRLLPSGAYLARLKHPAGEQVRRVVLLE